MQPHHDVLLYPNPAVNEFTISYSGGFYASANLTIYDVTGRLIQTYPLTGTSTVISTATLPPGIYVCRIDADGTGVISRKLIVMKLQ